MIRVLCLSCATELQLRSVVHKIADLVHLPRASGAWHRLTAFSSSWRARASDGSLSRVTTVHIFMEKGGPPPKLSQRERLDEGKPTANKPTRLRGLLCSLAISIENPLPEHPYKSLCLSVSKTGRLY